MFEFWHRCLYVRVRTYLSFSLGGPRAYDKYLPLQHALDHSQTVRVMLLAKKGDPDMDTMPVLAWSMQMARAAHNSTSGRFMIVNQVHKCISGRKLNQNTHFSCFLEPFLSSSLFSRNSVCDICETSILKRKRFVTVCEITRGQNMRKAIFHMLGKQNQGNLEDGKITQNNLSQI